MQRRKPSYTAFNPFVAEMPSGWWQSLAPACCSVLQPAAQNVQFPRAVQQQTPACPACAPRRATNMCEGVTPVPSQLCCSVIGAE